MNKVFSEGKLFGKINIIDIIVIVLFVICIVIGYLYLSRNDAKIVNLTQHKFAIELKEAKQEIEKYINIGDEVYDNENNKYIGKVVSFEIIPSKRFVKDYDKEEFINSEVEGLVNVKLVIESNLKDSNVDLKTTEDYEIRVGKDVFLRGPDYSGRGYIVSFER